MPECLNNSEGIFPYYYDPLYDQALNPFEAGYNSDVEDFLQSICTDILGHKLGPEKFKALRNDLEAKGLLHRRLGDPEIKQKAVEYLKGLKMAGRIARVCQI